MAVAVLYQTKSGNLDHQRVEQWLMDGLERGSLSGKVKSALRRDLAAVYNLQGQFQKAEDAYRRCLAEDSHDSLSMNNLAWLLASRGRNLDEALELIQRAIDTSGPLPGYLDTRGIVFSAKGEDARALRDLEEVVADNPTAVGLVHLAMAHSAANNTDRAREALRQAHGLLGPR